ncbi:XRE family transcriptional regulator [Streptococcus iniae]|uniref:helix-turn-helix domain-containing protein n=1 Tax=Streptococcus iniae TaxID=1346 RepID=UPI00037A10C9|nr:helix-turn-helix transcriptional regulator [Streptococcus iniae]ESR10152.1 XRE family transcriptional regulator [Streptococcus iniae IUSA1]KYJ82919.1 XRE family transcriptional regulator [Streptococcus iniae]RLV28625.1 XRE family transcriptional regulator [Streptococcus iniae]RMI76813.1 XRE family transcriptional regulator [Streptococcus iniae]HEK4517174.1 helix-turn-helix transcriptional regulator [Streptococcus iniae]
MKRQKVDLSHKLRQLRIDRGVKKSDLVTYLTITQRTYDRYEDGSRKPDFDTLIKLTEFYDCILDDLVIKYRDTTLVDRSLVVSCRDLQQLGLNSALSHGLIKQVYDGYSYEEIPNASLDKKIKFVYKKDIIECLKTVVNDIEVI